MTILERHNSSTHNSDHEDSFESASERTPRTVSQSPGRSLINNSRSSSLSTAKREEAAVEAPRLPASAADTPAQDEPASPKPSQRKVSVTSMDDVNLDGAVNESSDKSTSENPAAPTLPPRSSVPDASSIGLSGQLPKNDFPPPPSIPEKVDKPASMAPPPAPTRKLTSPFSWLTRGAGSQEKKSSTSPPPTQTRTRKNTVNSVSTVNSNPDLMLSKMEEEALGSPNKSAPARNSLKDRFKLLRMREEAGIAGLDDDTIQAAGQPGGGGALAGLIGRSMSVGVGISSPEALNAEDKRDGLQAMGRTYSTPGPLRSPEKQPTINPSLAPGTASGIAAGPADEATAPVDWDLWQSVVYEGPAAVARTSAEELSTAIASGIPQAIRGVVWQVLAQSKNEDLEVMYKELVVRGTDKEKPTSHHSQSNSVREKDSVRSSASSIHSDYSTPATTTSLHQDGNGSPNSNDSKVLEALAKSAADRAKKDKDEKAAIVKLEKVIRRDMGARTSYSKYLMSAGLQEGLFGICKAYALFDEAVGYAQGMNFIAMPLLFNMPEEEAFCLLVKLMNKYGLRNMFVRDMPGLHLHLYQFERLLEDFEPALYCHLHRRNVTPQLYATQWFLTLFAYRFPLQLVLRIYDLILSEGLEGAILKFGIVLMQKNAKTLLEMKDMATLSSFLKERIFDVYIDKAPSASSLLDSGFFGSAGGVDKEVYRADVLVQDACAIKITPEMLKAYTDEWNEKQRAEKEREAELENLRQTNTTLTSRVRNLEERIEKSDNEHVTMASDLVRTKVENETLSDQHESLQGQVDELKRIVDAQPAEVEARLKAEMERIMTRNIEVQNENRALEEQMAEMERNLVATKLQYAEINSEYETLKQKWSNIQTMLNNK